MSTKKEIIDQTKEYLKLKNQSTRMKEISDYLKAYLAVGETITVRKVGSYNGIFLEEAERKKVDQTLANRNLTMDERKTFFDEQLTLNSTGIKALNDGNEKLLACVKTTTYRKLCSIKAS